MVFFQHLCRAILKKKSKKKIATHFYTFLISKPQPTSSELSRRNVWSRQLRDFGIINILDWESLEQQTHTVWVKGKGENATEKKNRTIGKRIPKSIFMNPIALWVFSLLLFFLRMRFGVVEGET